MKRKNSVNKHFKSNLHNTDYVTKIDYVFTYLPDKDIVYYFRNNIIILKVIQFKFPF